MSGSIFIESASYSVPEQNGLVSITFKRTGDTTQPVNITYDINPLTALSGSDYTGTGGIARLEAGETTLRIDIPITDDALSETTEIFNVSIVSVDSGALLFPRTTNVSILDDETPVVDPANPPLESDYDVNVVQVTSGLTDPIAIEWLPGSTSQAIVVEQQGRLLILDTDTGTQDATLLDIRDNVNSNSDRGLMDIALHPDFEANPFLYAFYVVEPEGAESGTAGQRPDAAGNRFAHVVRYELDTEGALPTIVPGSQTILLGAGGQTFADISGEGRLNYTNPIYEDRLASDVDPTTGQYKADYIKVDSQSHAGGALAFGPDGNLYVSIGDGTSFNYADPRSADVQDVNSLSGKILRVDPLTGLGLPDNPFVAPGDDLSANSAKVYQLGLRNPYTMTFTEDGDLFLSETGWFSYEEINSGPAGANFGWPFFEGGDNGELVRTPQYADLPEAQAFYDAVEAGDIVITPAYRAFSRVDSDPGFQFNAIVGSSSVYSGDKYPASFLNDYFFTDIPDGEIFAIDTNDRTDVKYLTDLGPYGPTNFAQGPDGFIYLVDYIGGNISRLEISDPNVAPNAAPILDRPIEEQTTTVGADFAFQVPAATFADPDGDPLVFAASTDDGRGLPDWLSFNPVTGQFSGTPTATDVGSLAIRVSATDPGGETTSDVFSLSVGGANARPIVVSALPSQTATVGAALVFGIPGDSFADANGDTLTFSATRSDGQPLPSWLSFNPATGQFSGTPEAGDAGRFAVTVVASDPSGATTSDSFLVEVEQGVVENTSPIVQLPLTDQVVAEEAPFDFLVPDGTFFDADSDPLTLSATRGDDTALPGWLSFDPATGRFNGTPDDADVGTISVAVTARDGDGAEARDVFNLTVSPVNDDPTVAAPIADQSASIGEAFSFLVPGATFTDPDDTSLDLSVSGPGGAALPDWLSFDPATGAFSGTPAAGDTGTVEIELTARDAEGLTATDLFTVTVAEGGASDETIVADIASVNQTVTGTTDNDVFAYSGSSSLYSFGETLDGQGIVVWTISEADDTFDLLFGFETLRFSDQDISIGSELNPGSDVVDDPTRTQYLTGQGDSDRFVIDGLEADYGYGPTDSGTGVVIWTNDPTDDAFDILFDFEELVFNDVTVDISALASTGAASVIARSAASTSAPATIESAGTAAGETFVVSEDVLGSAAAELIRDFSDADGDRLDLGALLDANFAEETKDDYVRAASDGAGTTVQVDSDGAGSEASFEDVAVLEGVGAGAITIVDETTTVEITIQTS